MSGPSPAICGFNSSGAASFAFAFNGSGGAAVNKAIVQGGYYLFADVALWIKAALTSGLVDVAVPGSTQPAINRTVYVPASSVYPLDITGDNMSISVLGATTSAGTLQVSGPMAFSTVK